MEIWGSAWAQLGAVGLVGLVLVLFFTGRLLPRSLVKDMLSQAQQAILQAEARAQADREARDAAVARADLLASTLTDMASSLRSVEALVRAGIGRPAA